MKPIALLLPLLLATASTAQANLLVNPSFELPALTAASTCDGGTPWCLKGSGNAPGWTVTGNGVTVIHNNYLGGANPPILVTASDGVQYLDMNQAGGQNGSIYQMVAATPGLDYQLSLDAAAWATNAVGAAVAYELTDPVSGFVLANGSFTAGVGGVWTTRTLVATAVSGFIGVSIRSTFSPQAAIAVDNVVLAAVPEPGAWVLMLAGLGLVARVARHRQRPR
jgi:hypothetical protein